ncbi:MAG: transglutaminase family protein [Microbacteriaceae bacterium]
MQRTVTARLELSLSARTDLVLALLPATPAAVEESLSITLDGRTLPPRELRDDHGTRLCRLQADAGRLLVHYEGRISGASAPAEVDELDLIRYLRPSRYCESDALMPTARGEFAGLAGHALLRAVTQWVADRLRYVPGASLPTDGATRTLLAREGVCRDYAHLLIALLRALDVPARLVAVYAPGLDPMDFHAVVEAHLEGAWWLLDATRLAPRQSLVRIATGRDAADTAFLTNHLGEVHLESLEVGALAEPLPSDDGDAPVRMG